MDDTKVVNSMLDKLTKRVQNLAQNKKEFGSEAPVKVATESLWGIMYMKGPGGWVSLPDARKCVVHEIRRRCICSWAVATEAVTRAVSILSEYGYIILDGDKATPSEHPPFLPNLMTLVDRRWMEPYLHVVKCPTKDAFPSFGQITDATFWITFRKTLGKELVTSHGVVDSLSFDKPLQYFVRSNALTAIANCGQAVYTRMGRLREALEDVNTGAFMFSQLNKIRLSGDPIAAVALSIAAVSPEPSESTAYTLRYDCTESDFRLVEKIYA